MRRTIGLTVAGLFVLAACTPAAPPAAPTPAAPTPAAPTPADATPTPVADSCARDNLALKNPGQLTLSTDNPAFPPWWGGDPEQQYPGQADDATGWEVSNPYSGEGLEGGTAYAVAEKLGFGPDEIVWLQNAVFEQAFAPGPKPFDWHMAQVSIRAERAEAVDFSDPYFDSNQSLLALTGNDITGETTIEGLRGYRLGAAANTTSFELIENVIQPTTEPLVFPDNSTAKVALENGQIDGLIVDLGTAFYIRDAELEDWDTPDPEGTIVGAFSESEQVDQVGMVLEKDSALTECVNQALAELRADGTLDEIYNEWIGGQLGVPFFQP
ncbi:MAG TPA: transporter substrate-binding domain-containing protein [Candidatus Limnocylindria bacterium]|jgi:polar amino acid transport system substrate-binding protein|nr:transporter substrate-binding domain-containing protein [Candidatus Limnocylindria bacterium]